MDTNIHITNDEKGKSRFCSGKRVEHAHDEGKLMMINIINIEYIIPIFLSSFHDIFTMNQLEFLDNINAKKFDEGCQYM